MYFPLITYRSRLAKKQRIYPRAGGGGGGRGGGGRGGRGGGGGGGSGGSAGGRSSAISVGGTSRSATPYGGGGGPVSTIPPGQLFAGREQGGGTRSQVYGTSQYGSGYPSVTGRGVDGRGFPFYFWPVAWGGAIGAGAGGSTYVHTRQYGSPDNSSRPGGPMTLATFVSSSSSSTFHLLADNATVTELIQDIRNNCSSSNLNTGASSTSSVPYNDTDPHSPQPESVIQYYRASSVVLTLEGYNNSAVFQNEGTPDTPLPGTLDITLKDCLNYTIGAAVPLIGGADVRAAPSVSCTPT
ncbi:hypothetical protein WG66_009621 [Moniliophthora roreri]|nr:hypothetical protein WG66_009621 [Moniliophthora roreri]